MRRAILIASVLTVTGLLAWAQTGIASSGPDQEFLDASFSGDGKVISRLRPHGSWANALAIQSDGRIVVAGEAFDSNPKFMLARYDTDGSLDITFGGDGKVTTDFSDGEDSAGAIAIQTDGKIVVAGKVSGSSPMLGIARYDADGTLDDTFGAGGKVMLTVPLGVYLSGLAIQSDGRIVAGGGGILARYTPDGTLDTTFGGDGAVEGHASAVAIQTDGKIVVATGLGIARYLPDGSLDTSFGGDGMAETNGPWANAVTIQGDGRIVAAGGDFECFMAGDCEEFSVLFRFNVDGSPDTTFSDDGVTGGAIGEAYGIAVQADGRIIATGRSGSGHFVLTRHHTDGTSDTTFGGDGRIFTRITPGSGYSAGARALALQADGRIVAAGGAQGARFPKFALARYAAA